MHLLDPQNYPNSAEASTLMTRTLSSADFFDFFLLRAGGGFFCKSLVALSASISIASLFDAFGATDGVIDDDAHFLVARAAHGWPGARRVVITTFFPLRVFSLDILPSPWPLIGGSRCVYQCFMKG